jgi:hypothetical protein
MHIPESNQSTTKTTHLAPQYAHWEKVKELIDQLLDLTPNSRQSGHPGGSRSKVYSADWDNRWRTGGALEEVLEEAHLSPEWILRGIHRFVHDRPHRLARLQQQLDEAVTLS